MKFYIYGVPNGFNLYKGTAEEDQYFQLFYDGSKEESKLTINRKETGEIVYSYLRYNMVSGGNRTGAFLGISVVFQDQYCENVTKLYDLFDFVFNDIIVRDNIIIERANTGYRFKIKKFEDANAEEIEKIFQSLRLNIDDNSSSFNLKYIDSSFIQSKQGLICKLSYDAGNASFLSALKNFSWLTISKSYKLDKANLVVELSPEQINVYDSAVKPMKDSIIQCYKNAVTNPVQTSKQVAQMGKKVQSALKVIKGYVGKQPQLAPIMEDYRTLNNQLIDLQSTLLAKQGTVAQPKPASKSQPMKKKNPQKTSNKAFLALLIALLGIVGAYWLFSDNSNDSDKGNNLISQNLDSIRSDASHENKEIQNTNDSKKTETEDEGQSWNEDKPLSENGNSGDNNQNDDYDGLSMSEMVKRSGNDGMNNSNTSTQGHIRVDKLTVQKGGTITVTWTGEPNGEWLCRYGSIEHKSSLQTKISFNEIPPNGKANIVYSINGSHRGSVVINVVPKGTPSSPSKGKGDNPKKKNSGSDKRTNPNTTTSQDPFKPIP